MKDKDNYILAEELSAELIDGSLVLKEEDKYKLKKLNSKNVLIDVFVNVEDDIDNFEIDRELFVKITETQRIPKKVTLDFFCVKGEIHDNDFLLRLSNV